MSTNPASAASLASSSMSAAPEMQPDSRRMSSRHSCGSSAVATTSLTASRPPGLSTRNASRKTAGLSGERLITQLEMITSTDASATGRCSISPRRNSTFSSPAFCAFSRALPPSPGSCPRRSRARSVPPPARPGSSRNRRRRPGRAPPLPASGRRSPADCRSPGPGWRPRAPTPVPPRCSRAEPSISSARAPTGPQHDERRRSTTSPSCAISA